MIRGFLLLGFIGITGYFAALYRSSALMAIGLSVAVLGAALFLLAHVQCFRVRILFLCRQDIARKGEAYCCEYEAENQSRLPCGRIRFVLLIRGAGGQRKKTAVQGTLAGKEKIRAGVNIRFSRCGIFQIELKKLRVWDPLAVFSAGRRQKRQMQVMVLPPERHLRLTVFQPSDEQREEPIFLPDDPDPAQEEIRQLREYQPGDLPRHIHWNLSARSDKLWIKEYEGEADERVVLLLTNERRKPVTPDGLEAFYAIISALVCGLLDAGVSLELIWSDAGKRRTEHETICTREDMAEVFRKLYQLDQKQFLGRVEEAEQEGLVFLRADYDRSVYAKDREVYRFSSDHYEAELEQELFL